MRLFLVIALLLWQSLAHADTSVWKVTKGEQSLFIGGTLHVLAPSDYPLPDSYSESYLQAQTLVFETDLSALSTPDLQLRMLSVLTYPKGKDLKCQTNHCKLYHKDAISQHEYQCCYC